MPTPQEPAGALQEFLNEAEARLSRRLREAAEVEARGVSSESAGEIRRLEDTLLRAAMAAEQVLTVRHQIERTAAAAEAKAAPSEVEAKPALREIDVKPSREAEAQSAPQLETREDTTVREFTDGQGRSWRAWPVVPNSARTREARCASLGEFQEGWICFEALDNSGRRRLPRREPRWRELEPEELQGMLDRAIHVPGRKPGVGDAVRNPDAGPH